MCPMADNTCMSNNVKGLVYRVVAEIGKTKEDLTFTNMQVAMNEASYLLMSVPFEGWQGEPLIGNEIACWSNGGDFISVFTDIA